MKELQTSDRSNVREEDVGKLISLAGSRLREEEEPDAAAFAHAEAAWQEAVLQQKKRSSLSDMKRSLVLIAMAACLMVSVFAGSKYLVPDTQSVAMVPSAASVLNATGDYRITLAGGGSRDVAASNQVADSCRHQSLLPCADVPQGSLLVAGKNTYLWLELANTALVYAQPDSEMTLQSDGSIWLHAGRVYVDASADSAQVTVFTKHSKILDIGTQYEVSVGADATEVRTREGVVEVTTASTLYVSKATDVDADVVAFDDSGKLVRSSRISVVDSSWDWRHQAIAPFNLEGQSVADLALWIAQVEGSKLEFATSNTRFSASNELLSGGSIQAKNALREGRETVNEATGFNLLISESRLLLQRK